MQRLEDPLVDLLIADATAQGIGAICGNFARAWIDLNRRETEVDPRQINPPPTTHIDHRSPRVAAGLGLVPQTTGNGRPLYDRPLAAEALMGRIHDVHRPYHARIETRLDAMKARHGIALLCDMHSMPSLPPAQAADIVIGDRHGRTAASWIVEAIADWFPRHGYRTVRNLPYAGGHSVERHGRPQDAIHAVQIEFDRRLYLKQDSVTLNDNANSLKTLIAGMGIMLHDMLTSDSAARLAAE